MKAMIVEDNLEVRTLLEIQIRSFGYDVTSCADAENALVVYRQVFPQLIVVDLGLPGMDGLEFCRRIRTLPGRDQSMVLIITAWDTIEDLQAALEAGADDYLIKPVSFELLKMRIMIIEQQLQNCIQRKQAEEALRESEETARALLNAPTDIVLLIDPKGIVLDTNKITASILGTSVEKLIGSCLWNSFSPDITKRKKALVEKVVQSGDLIRYEDEQHGVWRDTIIYPIFDVRGRVSRLAMIARNITEHKRAEEELTKYRQHLEELVEERTAELKGINVQLQQEITERKRIEQALRASEGQYRSLAENVADGVVILRDRKLVFVNDALASMLSYPSDQLFQINPVDLLRDDYREFGRERIELAEKGITTGAYWQVPCVSGDGREVWVETRPSFIKWEDKPAILVTVRDVTEHKLQEIAIKEEREQLQRENITLRSSIKDCYRFEDIIGKSPAMQNVYELISRAAASDFTVIICGESGTGKELIAQTIHHLSNRQQKQFVPVNCGAIPENLFESEFFGHKKGAFTGAHQDQRGLFNIAHQGTLFLDEVGELSPNMQVKLLRALEDGEYTPVGDNTFKNADVRVIAATNRNLEDQVEKGLLRKDFFYRIQVVTITVPPLRERREDIPLLIDYFLEQYSEGDQRPTIPGRIVGILCKYEWPGNVRELQNVLQRYLTIKRLDFPGSRKVESVAIDDILDIVHDAQKTSKLHEALGAFEKHFIISTLEQHHWHRENTAKALGIPIRNLYRKMKKYQIL